MTGLDNFATQPFDFAGDIRVKDVVVLRFTQPFEKKVIFPSRSARFFRFYVDFQRDQNAVVKMNALVETLMHVGISRQGKPLAAAGDESNGARSRGDRFVDDLYHCTRTARHPGLDARGMVARILKRRQLLIKLLPVS